MSYRIPHLIAEHILPNLTSDQIDEMRQISSEFNKKVEKNRLAFPRRNMKWMRIQSTYEVGDGDNSFCDPGNTVYFEDTTGFRGKVEMDNEDLPKNLRSVQADFLEIVTPVLFECLDEQWLRTVKTLKVSRVDDEPAIVQHTREINCSRLILTGNETEIMGVWLLKSMPSVEVLEISLFNNCLEFFKKLAEKTRAGTGLERLVLDGGRDKPIVADHFIEFIKNAKFSPAETNCNRITITVQEGTSFRIHSLLMHYLNKCPGWKVEKTHITGSEYFITTPESSFALQMILASRWP